MGRGGGSHRSGGGHRSHSHSHSSHHSRSHYHSRNGGGGDAKNSLSSLIVLSFFFFFFFACLVIGLIMFLLTGARVENICDGITSINNNEQRTCKPPKTEDVKIPSMKRQVTAYRYDDSNLPPTERRTTRYTEHETVVWESWKYFDFALMKGGSVAFNYQISSSRKAGIYLMNREQYIAFSKSGYAGNFIWGKTQTSYATHNETVDESGLYYIVVDNQGYSNVYVDEDVTISTDAYIVSKSTAKDFCSYPDSCKFKKVAPTETVIVNYSGSSSYVNVEVHRGKGSFDKNATAPLAFMIFFLLLFGILWLVCFLKALKKCGKKAKKVAEKAAEKAVDGTVKVEQSAATPGSVPMTPVGPTPGAAPYSAYDTTMSAASSSSYPYPGMENPYPDGMPPPDPTNPFGVPAPAYGADPSAAPYPGQPGYGVPSTTV